MTRIPRVHLLGKPNQPTRQLCDLQESVDLEKNHTDSVILYAEHGSLDPALIPLLTSRGGAMHVDCRGSNATYKILGNVKSDPSYDAEARLLITLLTAKSGDNLARASEAIHRTRCVHTFLLCGLESLPGERIDGVFDVLVDLVESSKLRLIIHAESRHFYLHNALDVKSTRRNLEERCLRYRVASWTADEIMDRYWPDRIGSSLEEARRAACQIFSFTGGHPLLTDGLVAVCRHVMGEPFMAGSCWQPKPGKIPDQHTINEQGYSLLRNSVNGNCASTGFWQASLLGLIQKRAVDALRLEIFLQGGSLECVEASNFKEGDMNLFCDGWLQYSQDPPRFEMRSAIHAAIARETLFTSTR